MHTRHILNKSDSAPPKFDSQVALLHTWVTEHGPIQGALLHTWVTGHRPIQWALLHTWVTGHRPIHGALLHTWVTEHGPIEGALPPHLGDGARTTTPHQGNNLSITTQEYYSNSVENITQQTFYIK